MIRGNLSATNNQNKEDASYLPQSSRRKSRELPSCPLLLHCVSSELRSNAICHVRRPLRWDACKNGGQGKCVPTPASRQRFETIHEIKKNTCFCNPHFHFTDTRGLFLDRVGCLWWHNSVFELYLISMRSCWLVKACYVFFLRSGIKQSQFYEETDTLLFSGSNIHPEECDQETIGNCLIDVPVLATIHFS